MVRDQLVCVCERMCVFIHHRSCDNGATVRHAEGFHSCVMKCKVRKLLPEARAIRLALFIINIMLVTCQQICALLLRQSALLTSWTSLTRATACLRGAPEMCLGEFHSILVASGRRTPPKRSQSFGVYSKKSQTRIEHMQVESTLPKNRRMKETCASRCSHDQ